MRKGVPLLIPFFTAAYLCVTVVVAAAFNLPDTAQRQCYQDVDPYAEIPCAGTGQDGEYIQNPLSYTDNALGSGTVRDNNTGLVWQKEDDGKTYNWYQATGTYHAMYNPTTINVCGPFGHLPSPEELVSIVDYAISYPGPTIHPVFTNTKADAYWTSALASDSNRAYAMSFNYGCTFVQDCRIKLYVRCVGGK